MVDIQRIKRRRQERGDESLEQQIEDAQAEIARLNREANRLQKEVQDFANNAGEFLLADARVMSSRFERLSESVGGLPSQVVALARAVFAETQEAQVRQMTTLASQVLKSNSNGMLSGRIRDMLPYIAAGVFLRGRQHMAIDILEALQKDVGDKSVTDLSDIINRLSAR